MQMISSRRKVARFRPRGRIVECSPYLKREAQITQNRIIFPETGAVITAIASDYAGAAGANPVVSSFDELWAFVSERSRRLWDEMVPPPTRKVACRLTTTYAGFSGESQLLEELYRRGMAQPEVGTSLRAGDGLLMAWHHEPVAPWQTDAWLAQMSRSLRPNQYLRMIENRFVTAESSFIDLATWDRCVRPELGAVPSNPSLPVWVGVDASVRHDSSAIVAVTYKDDVVRLVFHRILTPLPNDPINFADNDKISREDILAHAYAQCRSNKGAPGVDGQEFADIEAYGVQRWLGELALAPGSRLIDRTLSEEY